MSSAFHDKTFQHSSGPMPPDFLVMMCLFMIAFFGASLTLAFNDAKKPDPFPKEIYVFPIRSRDLMLVVLGCQFIYVVFFWSFASFLCFYPLGFSYDFTASLLLCVAQSFLTYSLTMAMKYFVSVPAARYVNTVFYILCLFCYSKLLALSPLGVSAVSIVCIIFGLILAQKTVDLARIDEHSFWDKIREWPRTLFRSKTTKVINSTPRNDFNSPFQAQLYFEATDSLRTFLSMFAASAVYVGFMYFIIPNYKANNALTLLCQCAVMILLTSGVSRFIGTDGRVMSFCLTRPVRSGYLAAAFEMAAIIKPLIVCIILSIIGIFVEGEYFQLTTMPDWILAIKYTSAVAFAIWLTISQIMLFWIWGALTGQGLKILLAAFIVVIALIWLSAVFGFIYSDLFSKMLDFKVILLVLKLIVFAPLFYWTVFKQRSISIVSGALLLTGCTIVFMATYLLANLIPSVHSSTLSFVCAILLTPATSLILPVATLHARRSR